MKSIHPSILLAGALAALAVTTAISQEPADQAAPKNAAKKKALPLKATRKVEFTTDEATWLSLDVSPDGQAIVFELLGDLYTVPVAGGAATRLPLSDSSQDEHSFPKTAAQAAKIQRAGGLVGVGGHGQLQGLGYHWELWSLASGGMTPLEVLKAATRDGAEIIGLGQDLGVVEPGRLADLVIMTKDPLQDIKNTNSIRYVMKNGELYEGDTLNQVWPAEKKIPSFWWWNDKPGK